MKRKIGINTLNGYLNYGNRLQLFALSTILSRLGFQPSVYWPIDIKSKIRHILKRTSSVLFLSLKEKKLKCFSKEYTPGIKRTAESCMIYGSDQVWNPNYIKRKPYLLRIKGNRKNISYAASMGVNEITSEQAKIFKNALMNFSAISVREQSAKDLLQPLTDKPIEVVLDPTLLLDRTEYESLERRPEGLEKGEKYILCYILGNRDHEVAIERIAEEKGCETIYFSDKRDSNYGVEEFLYLIHHAQMVCTDSFHACVFSFIFERSFVVFRRTGEAGDMYTRLQNLIDTFQLKNREFNGKEITKENLEVDYTEAKKILKKEQKKSLDFLKKALDIKE